MHNILRHCMTACALVAGATVAVALEQPQADASRQADVRRAGADVMPFSLDQTLHTFDKTPSGGVQRVRVRGDAPEQVAKIRAHLQAIASAFERRDFSGPAHIHGAGMPGLSELKSAGAGELTVGYRELADGAEIVYTGHTATIVDAIHRWFDAQLRDHGHDAATSALDAAKPVPRKR